MRLVTATHRLIYSFSDTEDDDMGMEVDQVIHHRHEEVEPDEPAVYVAPDYSAAKTGLTCLPQRAALLKSMLNFLKKAIQVRKIFQEIIYPLTTIVIDNRSYFNLTLFCIYHILA